jgi:hypothetical protein
MVLQEISRRKSLLKNREVHDYQLYLVLESIDHTKAKARSPQKNGIRERFHRTILNEYYNFKYQGFLSIDLVF